jgi:glycosidase
MPAVSLPSGSTWFREAIVYHILVDRYAGYNPKADPMQPVFIGGNLQGIIDRFAYLSELGINTIWLSPVFKTIAYHGYHITDFFSTDNRFGTEDDLRNLIDLAHQKNIRVILDFVPNHCSCQHPYFAEAFANRHSRYRKWFYFNRFSNEYQCFLGFSDLPKINLDHSDARRHIMEAGKKWIAMGIDGFRLDHVVGPSTEFWTAFSREIKAKQSEAVLIGEAWLDAIDFKFLRTIRVKHKYLRWILGFKPGAVQRDYVGILDGVLDFYFRHRITEYIAWKADPSRFSAHLSKRMQKHYRNFPEGYSLPTFVDNHDMNRFLFDCGQDRDKLRQALRFQFSLSQPPVLYYGTETGLSHLDPVQGMPYSDLHARQPMPWNALDHELIDFTRELIWKRRKI